MSNQIDTVEVKPAAWRVKPWKKHVPLSDSQIWELIATGEIKSVKIGGCRLITESPEEFIARHREPVTAA